MKLIGTAGWGLPRAEQTHFPGNGSPLQRYAARFSVAEVNSSFHRSHRPTTWTRWHDSVPQSFRFSVKVPKTITHTHSLKDADELVAEFLSQASLLRSKLRCLLVQLAPSLAFDRIVAGSFFGKLRELTPAPIACEPRHASWFEAGPGRVVQELSNRAGRAGPGARARGSGPGAVGGVSVTTGFMVPRKCITQLTQQNSCTRLLRACKRTAGLGEKCGSFLITRPWEPRPGTHSTSVSY